MPSNPNPNPNPNPNASSVLRKFSIGSYHPNPDHNPHSHPNPNPSIFLSTCIGIYITIKLSKLERELQELQEEVLFALQPVSVFSTCVTK
jgi:hypothetical protein